MIKNDCHICAHKKSVPGNTHIQCIRADTEMTGSPYGIQNGWFFYPVLFDPIWMEKKCCNFELNVEMVKEVLVQ